MSLLARPEYLRIQDINMRRQSPAIAVLQAAGEHNLDYVNFAPSVSCEGCTSELPCEAAAGKRPGSGTSRDPVRRRAAHFAREKFSVGAYSEAQSAAPWEPHRDS